MSTFSLVANKPEGGFTFLDGALFAGKRILKLTPFNVFILGFANCLGPLMGGGPYWDYYEKAYSGCKSHWWTNLVFINNIYPSAFDEKCMGWTWIIPCYVQLTLILPVLILFFQELPKTVSASIYGVIFLAVFILNISLIYSNETGLFGRFDNELFLNNDFLA